jgi:hypothetical protein
MILTIAGADFSGANIGTNTNVGITLTKGNGVSGSKVSSLTLEKNQVVSTATVIATGLSLQTGYENLVVTVTMNGSTVSGWFSNGTVTIPSGTTITGNIKITASATAVSGGEVVNPEEPGTGGGSGDTPSRLPSEYQEVEYLKTSETQYFVLDEVSSNVIYEIKFRSDQLTSADGLIGCYSSSAEANRSQIRISCQSNSAGKTYHGIEFMYGAEGSVEKTNVATTQITVDYWTQPNVLKVDANKLYWNGELKVTRTAFTSNALATPFTLFAQNNNNAGTTSPGFGRQAAVECYYVKIQDTSKSINKELIPCYRKSDNAIGFYDIIGETFITPTAGTITEKGPNV